MLQDPLDFEGHERLRKAPIRIPSDRVKFLKDEEDIRKSLRSEVKGKKINFEGPRKKSYANFKVVTWGHEKARDGSINS